MPQKGGQTIFLQKSEFEVLFGGSAGPGKSWSLVIDALGLQFEGAELGKKAIDIPEYRAVIFRRRSTQLAELIDEAKRYYPDFGGEYTANRRGDPGPSFTFPSGARIYFCHLNEEKDKESHHGFEYQFVGFDELTQFTYTQYIYLFSRCRSTIPGLFPRVRSTTNPIGEGLRWVRIRFEPHLRQNVTQWFITDMQDEKNYRGIEVPEGTPYALSRCYVPGKLQENRILIESDPTYVARLKAMGKRMAKALLESDWSAMEGQFFDTFSSSIHIVREKDYLSWTDIKLKYNLEGGLDYGNDTVLVIAGKDKDGNIIFFDELYMFRETRSQKIKKIKSFLYHRRLPKLLIVADTNMWIKDAFDKAEQESPALEFLKAGIKIVKVTKSSNINDKTYRKAANEAIKDYLYYETDEDDNITIPPKIKIYERCETLISCFTDLVADPDDPEDIADGQFDHPFDAAKYVFMHLSKARDAIEPGTPMWLQKLIKKQGRKRPKSFMEV